MLRTLMQVYVTDSPAAVALYQAAFDAKLVSEYKNDDGTYYHSELDVFGQILAVAEARTSGSLDDQPRTTGNIMQFCLHFHPQEAALVERAYATLCEGGQVLFPLGPCDFSTLMADLVDRFGVRWCLFA